MAALVPGVPVTHVSWQQARPAEHCPGLTPPGHSSACPAEVTSGEGMHGARRMRLYSAVGHVWAVSIQHRPRKAELQLQCKMGSGGRCLCTHILLPSQADFFPPPRSP